MTRISTMTLGLVLGAFAGQSALADGENRIGVACIYDEEHNTVEGS